jgi:hypothetical protein
MMGMGTHNFFGQMGKIDTRYWWKTIIFEKWLFMIQH